MDFSATPHVINIDGVKYRQHPTFDGLLLGREKYYDDRDNAPVAKYVIKDTEHYAGISNDQYTVPRNDKGTYDGILNADGIKLYEETIEKVKNGQFKDILYCYFFDRANSGIHKPDLRFDSNPVTALNSFNNKVALGLTKQMQLDQINVPKDEQKYLSTSSIIIYGKHKDLYGEFEWCLTRSGSLYKLVDKK